MTAPTVPATPGQPRSGGKDEQRLSCGAVRLLLTPLQQQASALRERVFYGWWMVAGGFVIQTVLGLFMFHAFGFYVERLEEEFKWSKTTFSLAFAMTRIESGVLGPIQGWAIDRFGPRIMIRIGIATTGIGFVLFSFVDSVTTFFLTYFLI
ncbi:MAG: MFS transporter, partial [Chloroflexi bacterium]|nr:MFS transporter [Chloroflexota bacterium]